MKTIGVSVAQKSAGMLRMLTALGEVLDVRFEERTLADDTGIDGWIIPETGSETLCRIALSEQPCYAVIRSDQLIQCGESDTIEFACHPALPPVLGGRHIKTDEAVSLKSLPQYIEPMTVLAFKAGAPVWAMQEGKRQKHHYVTLPVPGLNEGEPLYQYFHGKQFLQLLPLLLFLRTLTKKQRWKQPPLQACFMFDDPNLHWPTYGFIDFAQIASHAHIHNYHVSMATIPIDAWFVHRPTALLFRQHSDRLSLLIHGNDHITEELALDYSEKERNRILRQALRRISELEYRTGVEVSRVMAAPHGACSEEALEEMAQLGFESACISSGSLRRYNGQAAWLRTLGMTPSDIIRGLPVFHRFPLSGNCHNSILVAALLHQPIIARGHHNDVADGLQLLADVSEFVNSLGAVHWADMRRISRSHYASRLDGRILHVRMFTRRIEISVPESITHVLVERSWMKGGTSEPVVWRIYGNGTEWKYYHPDEAITVLPGQKLEIAVERTISPFIDAKNNRKINFWPVLRRQLTEARDRLAPLLKRVSNPRSNRAIVNQ